MEKTGKHSTRVKKSKRSAKNYKEKLLEQAWLKWNELQDPAGRAVFNTFCSDENEWLHDYALYEVLQAKFNQRPWYEWPQSYRDRNMSAITTFAKKNTHAIN